MEQNIHMLTEAIAIRSILTDSPQEHIVTSGETKNEPSQEYKTTQSTVKRVFNCDILSSELIESYSLHPAILAHTCVQQSHRTVNICSLQKMRLWIMQNCHIRHLSYKTASLACQLLDLYFSRGHNCQLQDLHDFGICCLRIANKLEDNIFIPINYTIFNREKLVDIQAQICLKVNFELNPLTFTDIACCLNHLWSTFRAEIKHNGLNPELSWLKQMTLEEKSRVVDLEYSFILLHQTLELLYLILDTLGYSVDHLVFNTFYMILCLQFYHHQKPLNSSKIHAFMRKSDKMSQIMTSFVSFCRESNYQLRLNVDESCLTFIYPVYNALIAQNAETKEKDQDICFNPNDASLRLPENIFSQTMKFKNKKSSLKRSLKRRNHQILRKSSEITSS